MLHNNYCIKYKNPFGAVKENTKVYIRIDVDKMYKHCILRLWTPDRQEEICEMNYVDKYYETYINISKMGLNWYFFIIEDFDYKYKFYGSKQGATAGEGTEYEDYPNKAGFQITCYDSNFIVPEWYKGSMIYQIFPDRFCRDNTYEFEKIKYAKIHNNFDEPLSCTQYGANNFEFYAGNIRGIKNKLNYIKELNTDVIYLNPIFQAKSNHRYDTSNYLKIDEMLGFQQDFIDFVNECHEKNIKVIIDVSWNHVGDDSIYFNKYKTFGNDGAYNNKNSNYRSWFNIKDNGTYDSWWGFDTLPIINKDNLNFREHVKEVVKKWVLFNIDGFRLDVVDELPDEFLEWFRNTVKSINKEMIIVGEVWEDASLKKDNKDNFRTYFYGKNQDSVMNYCLRNLLIDFIGYGYKEKEVKHEEIDGYTFYDKYMNILNNYPKECSYSLMNFLSTHDVNRIMTVFGDSPYVDELSKEQQGKYVLPQDKYDIAIKRIKLAWSFIVCSIGNPCIFYGDETGLYGYNDPYNRKPMNWSCINKDLQVWFKKINSLRTIYPVLKNGDMKFEYVNKNIVSFSRYNKQSIITYIMNRSDITEEVEINDNKIEINGLSYKIIEAKI